jgi:hypothetical protein
LRRADHSSKESYYLCKKNHETEEQANYQQMVVEPFMNELINELCSDFAMWIETVMVFEMSAKQ